MSKSADNTILLSEEPDIIRAKMKKAVTDPLKIRRGDPGRPEVCLVYTYHQKFSTPEVPEIAAGCRSGALACVDCKANAANHIIEYLAPMREKRTYFEKHPAEVESILHDGETRAQKAAHQTMGEVHEAMKLG